MLETSSESRQRLDEAVQVLDIDFKRFCCRLLVRGRFGHYELVGSNSCSNTSFMVDRVQQRGQIVQDSPVSVRDCLVGGVRCGGDDSERQG